MTEVHDMEANSLPIIGIALKVEFIIENIELMAGENIGAAAE